MSNVADSVVTLLMPGRSPNSTDSTASSMLDVPSITQTTQMLAPFLDNTPPTDAIVVPVFGDTTSYVWYWRDNFILTTNGQLTHPEPISASARLSSPDGEWRTYKLGNRVPPVFSILRRDGRIDLITVGIDEVGV